VSEREKEEKKDFFFPLSQLKLFSLEFFFSKQNF
jgi:hypothetical protein